MIRLRARSGELAATVRLAEWHYPVVIVWGGRAFVRDGLGLDYREVRAVFDPPLAFVPAADVGAGDGRRGIVDDDRR